MHANFSGRIAAVAAVLALVLVVTRASAPADEGGDPGVARLSVLRGAVDLKRADSGDTFAGAVNAPVSAGDYVTTGADAHAEIQYTFGASLRVASGTQLRFTRLDRDAHVAQLAAGTVELRLFRGLQAHPEVATPAATIRPAEDGRYRVTVTSDGDSAITVRSGRADVITQAGTRTLFPGSTLLVTGTGDATRMQTSAEAAYDGFDSWNGERDTYVERTRDFGYVDQGIVGADDLDRYGHWEDSDYGRAWRPDADPGWAPYNDGRWTWQPYYGWTWVAAEPWGWAPYHYGRWFYASNGWCWSPGVVARWPVAYSAPVVFATPVFYQPALVAFFSFGSGFGGFGFGNIGWVPLAPFETFRPWWGSRAGQRTTINNITNITNITNVTNVNNYYGSHNGGTVSKMYRNAAAPGGAVAVDAGNFTAGHFEHVRALQPGELAKISPVRGILPVVPTLKNLAYTNLAATATSNRIETRFVAFAPPRILTRPFEEQQAAIKQLTLKTYPKDEATPERPRPSERYPAAAPAGGNLPRPAAVPAGATIPRPAGVSHPVAIERIEGSTIQHTLAEPSGGASRVASPWDRFAPIRGEALSQSARYSAPSSSEARPAGGASGERGEPGATHGARIAKPTLGTLDVPPIKRMGNVPVTSVDPFSRFDDRAYGRSTSAPISSEASWRNGSSEASWRNGSSGAPRPNHASVAPWRSGSSEAPRPNHASATPWRNRATWSVRSERSQAEPIDSAVRTAPVVRANGEAQPLRAAHEFAPEQAAGRPLSPAGSR